ncbi:MAG: pantoate--beta-alanine ligase [Planctomycetota bacterium]
MDARETVVYLGLGANEGDREANLRTAVERLGAVPGVRVLRVSTLRPSRLVGDGPEQGEFLNGAVQLATTLSPRALLLVTQALERAAGRALPAKRNHPRPLDLDLLLYGDQRVDEAGLVVPHPRLFEREFALAPLRELGVEEAVLESMRPAPAPRLLRTAAELQAVTGGWIEGRCVVGMVPTMGALHRGHGSLLERARAECDRVVATIFVNPLQFGPNEDLASYPRQLERDLELCRAAGVDAVFAPSPDEMYPPGFCSTVDVGVEAETMEGAVRAGHFRGVATVVARLFALGRPHRAYFGQKDAQQLAVVQRMARDLGFPVRVVPCPVVREPDGLALSSRNVYLDPPSRTAALVLSSALRAAQQAWRRGERDRDALLRAAAAVLQREPRAELDYLELRSEPDVRPLPPGPVAGGRLLVAARFAGARPVRLLDTMALDEEPLPGPGAPDPRAPEPA